MRSLLRLRGTTQRFKMAAISLAALFSLAEPAPAADPAKVADAHAQAAGEMKPYTEVLANTNFTFDMLPIPGGRFTMGSPDAEEGRQASESPRREIDISPFWMGKCEVTWDEYDTFLYGLDIQRRKTFKTEPTELDKKADAVTRPTAPYTDMTFGKGKEHFPATASTQWAARKYCQWLSEKTGRYYRLPTEAEWEYACRAGTNTAYSFGNNPAQLDDFAWHDGNSGGRYHKVGTKKPNPWGLHDMHGNVREWTLDQFTPEGYRPLTSETAKNPLEITKKVYPIAVRGGAWTDDPDQLRSAARIGSSKEWKDSDPQLPQSIWWFTDAEFLGFRVIRPLVVPTDEEKAEKWDAGVDR